MIAVSIVAPTTMSPFLAGGVGILVIAAIVLILILTGRHRKDSGRRESRARDSARKDSRREGSPASQPSVDLTDRGLRRSCPLCGELLAPGQRVYSTILLSPTGERVMEIAGCPRCRPPSTQRRTCPVCKAILGHNDIVKARIYDRSRDSVKPHVRVVGCTKCRP